MLRRRVAGRMEGKLTAIVSPSEMTEIVCARTCALSSKETDRQTDSYVATALSPALQLASSFAIPINNPRYSIPILHSTPFEAGYYDDDLNLFGEDTSSLAVPPDTKLVLGLNKYSHDTSICAANAETGEVLFGISKERLTRQKHDSGNVAMIVETCLECLGLDYDAIEKVVVNNHHHRVLPLEANRAHLEWECGLGINGGAEDGYDDEENLLIGAKRVSNDG